MDPLSFDTTPGIMQPGRRLGAKTAGGGIVGPPLPGSGRRRVPPWQPGPKPGNGGGFVGPPLPGDGQAPWHPGPAQAPNPLHAQLLAGLAQQLGMTGDYGSLGAIRQAMPNYDRSTFQHALRDERTQLGIPLNQGRDPSRTGHTPFGGPPLPGDPPIGQPPQPGTPGQTPWMPGPAGPVGPGAGSVMDGGPATVPGQAPWAPQAPPSSPVQQMAPQQQSSPYAAPPQQMQQQSPPAPQQQQNAGPPGGGQLQDWQRTPWDNPNALQHLDFWGQHGWAYNPNTGMFHWTGGQVQGGSQPRPMPYTGDQKHEPPPVPGGGPLPGDPPIGGPPGGGGNPPPIGGPPDPYTGGLPLDPYYEAQRRMLEDQMSAQLAALDPQRQALLANQQLQSARLDTNQGLDTSSLQQGLAGRGLFGSGIQTRDMGNLDTSYLRQRQDLANSVNGGLGDIASQEGQVRSQYDNGLMEALLALAQRQANDPNAPVPHVPNPPPVGGGGGGNGGGGNGGGGGGRRRNNNSGPSGSRRRH